LIRAAAARRVFISCGEIAEAYALPFFKHRKTLFDHLGEVATWSYRALAARPLLTAVVVAKEHLQDGRMEGDTLAGFIRFAAALGAYTDGDPLGFLQGEQRKVFDWASEAASA
jgi:hypothetical protein